MEEKDIKKNTKNFSTAETILLVLIALVVGFAIGNLVVKPKTITSNTTTDDPYLQTFIKNYQFIVENYYEEVDKEDLINNAISGMTKSLNDPYSTYLDEEESSSFSIMLNGSYKGLGIEISRNTENGYMLVTGILKNSPASKSDLKVGDEIVSVNDKQAKDMTASQFSLYILNNENNNFDLKVKRDDETFNIKLSKNTISITSVDSKLFEEDGKKIGYIYIGIFANNTYKQFKEKLEELEKENIDALIIDVRGNTGGHLTAVDGILDLFLNSKQIMYQFEKSGKVTATYGTGKENKKYEIVLLGDKGSASASEVLIAGLKENLGSKLIGVKTYGKGTVQELVTLTDGTQYKITVKKWLTPKGVWINDNEGIDVDINIELDSKYFETYSDDDDNQLARAIEYIKTGK